MDISSIAGSSLLMSSGQTRQELSTTMMKQAAEQQDKMASLLAQNAKQNTQPVSESPDGFSFSTYA